MQFDPDNAIVKLCAEGMALEGAGKAEGAKELFLQAWAAAANDLEKFTAAHYLARHQANPAEKLNWDQTALHHALRIDDPAVQGAYPSLYLNIAKCYEDLNNPAEALKNYRLAESYTRFLNADGYGAMIKGGIEKGIKRVSEI